MKILISLMLILSTTFSSYAADSDRAAKKKERFTKAKSMALANIDKKTLALQETKNCISKANDKEALKSCRQQAKQRNLDFRDEMKQKRKEIRAQFGRKRTRDQ